ncbi:MAG: hypothetical protein HY657_17140 [Acidobacteria bacterium]|nr:hypothetical protein [Acidobacteriota bacterium]
MAQRRRPLRPVISRNPKERMRAHLFEAIAQRPTLGLNLAFGRLGQVERPQPGSQNLPPAQVVNPVLTGQIGE